MIIKFHGVWDMIFLTEEIDEVISYFKVIKKNNTKATKFCDDMLNLINESCKCNLKLCFAADEDRIVKLVNRDDATIDFHKEKLKCDLIRNCENAYQERTINKTQLSNLKERIEKIK